MLIKRAVFVKFYIRQVNTFKIKSMMNNHGASHKVITGLMKNIGSARVSSVYW